MTPRAMLAPEDSYPVEFLASATTSVAGYVPVPGSGTLTLNLSLAQFVNLVGAPLVALLFLPAVVSDFRRWAQERRQLEPGSRGRL